MVVHDLEFTLSRAAIGLQRFHRDDTVHENNGHCTLMWYTSAPYDTTNGTKVALQSIQDTSKPVATGLLQNFFYMNAF